MKKVPRDVGTASISGIAKVADLMTELVMTATRHQSVGHLREIMTKNGVHSMPVVNAERQPVGIITSMDLVETIAPETQIGEIMTRDVYTVPKYADVHIAARMMRNHHIHHLVVTDEGQVVGLVSSFDLLRLIENKRFVTKNLPSRPQKGGGQRRKQEDGPPDSASDSD